MKLFINYIQRLAMLAILAVMVLACSDKESLDGTESMTSDGSITLRIAISVPDFTRAGVPNGGEHGDGLEPGQHHENDINTLSLFACKGNINGDAATPVRLVAYLTSLNLTMEQAKYVDGMYVHELRVDDKFINGYEFSPADKFIIATNMQATNYSTLGDLRDAYVMTPVQKVAEGETLRGCTNFVMSNECESSYVQGNGSPENPHRITVTIERVTARVDLITGNAAKEDNNLHYAATDGKDDEKVGDVFVSHARVFNAQKSPSYLIKRLSESQTATSIYLGIEENPATRLVVEPTTWQKATDDAERLDYWYGASHISKAKALGDSWFRNADKVHTALPTAGNDGFGTSFSVDDNGYEYYVLDYVNENTMTPENTKSPVTTGVMLKAVYKPTKVYKALDADKKPVLDNDYTYGQTFWRYRPIMQTYDETKALYFSNEAAVIAYRDTHPEVIAEITAYADGKCYYPVHLRHDNTRENPYINIMEFGIVRNNIYRLKVSFTGPGYPNLDITEKVDPEGIRPYIFVRKWYKITHPVIEI